MYKLTEYKTITVFKGGFSRQVELTESTPQATLKELHEMGVSGIAKEEPKPKKKDE
jgi:hypothetical protein